MRAYLEAARENRKLQRIALTVAVFAAVFVVLGVFWALKNTGIAMTGDPTCGFVDHAHADACYEKTLKCGQEELEAHTHSIANGCYAASSTPAPAATDAAASSAAQASEAPSGAAQGTAAQSAQSTQTLVCEKPETPGHAHTDACYEKTLTCTIPEHTHSESCYGDAKADVETKEQWEATLPANLSGNWSKDVVAVAQSQLDYAESQENRTANENGEQKGYTRYGAWAGTPYADWSVPFAAFCLHYAGANDYPAAFTCSEWTQALQSPEYGLYHPVESGYEPKPGDVVFFAKAEDAEKVATARTQAAEKLAQAQAQAEAVAAQGAEASQSAETAAQKAQSTEIAAQDQLTAAYAEVTALADHVGIVAELLPADQNNPERIRVIQGDLEDKMQHVDKVQRIDYDRADKCILGYAKVPENAEELQDIVDTARLAASEPSDRPVVYYSEATGVGRVGSSSSSSNTNANAKSLLSDPHKTIDAFRDGVDNPDTSLDDAQDSAGSPSAIDKTDLYRLYLDAEFQKTAQGIDLLIVVDQSGSMHMDYAHKWEKDKWNNWYDTGELDYEEIAKYKDMVDKNGSPIFRDQALQLILNGAYSDDPETSPIAESEYLQHQTEGLVYQFLSENKGSQVAVVGFQGSGACDQNGTYDYAKNEDASEILDWTGTAQNINVKGLELNSTNYCAGVLAAEEMLGRVKNDGREKVILFISNGIPTVHIAQGRYKEEQELVPGQWPELWGYRTKYVWEADETGDYWRRGDGGETNDETKEHTRSYLNRLQSVAAEYGAPVHTVSVAADEAGLTWLKPLSDGTGGAYIQVNNDSGNQTEELRAALKQLMLGATYSDLVITDTLSEYVEVYRTPDGTIQPDFKVTMKERQADGTYIETPLYEKGSFANGGEKILQSVAVGADGSTGRDKVTAKFIPSYEPKPGTTFILSFNVKTTQTAHDEFKSTGYHADETGTGQYGTDYGSNVTSSGKKGFRSNTEATLTCKADGENQIKYYPHPVVQVAEDTSGLGSDPDPEAAISYHKTIDSFRDGVSNPDTTLDDGDNPGDEIDLYRLYLDAAAKGKEQAVDLVIVVDESESMSKPYDGQDTRRDKKVQEVLSGTGSEKGLIYDFLSMNKKNRIAVVGFDGSTGNGGYEEDVEPLSKDTKTGKPGWVSGENGPDACGFVTVEAKDFGDRGWLDADKNASGYTNYMAALMEANRLFAEPSPSTNKKAMIFLSDGVPTIYFDKDKVKQGGFPGYADTDQPWRDYVSVPNRSKRATQDYFEKTFQPSNSSVDVYTVGIIPNERYGLDIESLDPETLQFMAEKGHGSYLSAGNVGELESALRKFAKCSNVDNLMIEDTLSGYVDLYAQQPDFKVTMTNASGDAPVVLWEKGKEPAKMSNGRPIVQSVGYKPATDSSGKLTTKVTARFDPAYQLDPSCTYTLSFNVKTSEKAYNKYKEAGYHKDATGTGQDKTDYPGNNTSSNMPGFRSNDVAKVGYDVDGKHEEKKYDYPVIQVSYKLPETGGGGVGAFFGVGAALVTCAGVGLVAKRRRGVRV